MLHLQLSTIVFQVLNFLILLGLLGWFLYRPVVAAMRSRQEAIDARLRDADDRAREAEEERASLAAQTQQATTDADALLATTRQQAAEESARITAAARTKAAHLVGEAHKVIDEQERLALGRVEARVGESALTIAANLIRQAAGPLVHEQLVEQFLRQGVASRDSDSESIGDILGRDHSAVTVELAYPSSGEVEARIRELLLQELGRDAGAKDASFRVNPALIAGGRILAGEFVLDFSLQRTLEELKSRHATESATR